MYFYLHRMNSPKQVKMANNDLQDDDKSKLTKTRKIGIDLIKALKSSCVHVQTY